MKEKMINVEMVLCSNCDWFNIHTDDITDIFFDEDINRFVVEFDSCLESEEDYQEYLRQTPAYALDRSDYFSSVTDSYSCTIPERLNEVISFILSE